MYFMEQLDMSNMYRYISIDNGSEKWTKKNIAASGKIFLSSLNRCDALQ